MKKMLSILTLLLYLFTCVFASAEKKERIIWMASVVPDGDQYLMSFDFEDSACIGPYFSDGTAGLLHAIDCEPGAYFVFEKSSGWVLDESSGRVNFNHLKALVDVMHYDGETCAPCIEDMEVDNCDR